MFRDGRHELVLCCPGQLQSVPHGGSFFKHLNNKYFVCEGPQQVSVSTVARMGQVVPVGRELPATPLQSFPIPQNKHLKLQLPAAHALWQAGALAVLGWLHNPQLPGPVPQPCTVIIGTVPRNLLSTLAGLVELGLAAFASTASMHRPACLQLAQLLCAQLLCAGLTVASNG